MTFDSLQYERTNYRIQLSTQNYNLKKLRHEKNNCLL
jgi:hypothetical protein